MNAVESAIENFKAPSFAKGDVGTLHGVRSDADGYKFLRIALFGSPKVKVVKGCTLEFKNNSGDTVTCSSDTKDIESVYSDKLKKGITEFEIYLDDEVLRSFKKPMNTVTITFPKKLFGKVVCSFDIQSKAFVKFFR